jgi:hypothetical protein
MIMILRAIWAIALVLVAGSDPIFKLLPPDGTPPGWRRNGEERLFIGAALYRHINGGAELYHQHGFDRLAVQDYANGGHELRVEIYVMKSASGAASVFAEITTGMTTGSRFGTACVLDEYQVLFHRGSCCISLTTYEIGTETREAMAALAAKIDAGLLEISR